MSDESGPSVSVASALSASATIPTSRAVPGIAELHMQPLRSVGPRWVQRQQARRRAPIRIAAITPTRLVTEATRKVTALLDNGANRARRSAEPYPSLIWTTE